MQRPSGAVVRGSGQGDGKKRLRLLINPPRLQLDDRTIIFKYTGDGGWFCASFGDGAKYMRAADENSALRGRIDRYAARLRYGRDALGADLARVMAAVELSKDYDADEPRDDDGRWTSAGAGGVAAAGAVADATRMYGDPAYAEGLRQLATRALAALPSLPAALGDVAAATLPAAAFFGTLFIPAPRNVTSDGTLPDAPDFSYHFDQEAGHLTITRQLDDGTTETVFSARYGKDGVFRDENGNPIGRFLGGTAVALDADAITGYEARRRSDAQAPPGAIVQTDTATRDDPKLCPDPGPDKPGREDARAIEYQMVVGIRVNGEPLPPGMAIKINGPDGPAYFDDCNHEDGTLIEAKGDKYGQAMRSGRAYPWFGMVGRMMDQAQRQVVAAGDRGIEWHFADPGVADYMRERFAENGLHIGVVYTPPPDWWTEKLARMTKGAWYERFDFADLLAQRRTGAV